MRVQDIEIPQPENRHGWYRFFEILPGALSWMVLILPLLLSLVSVTAAAFIMIAYLLMWFIRAIALNIRVVQSYNLLRQHEAIDWQGLIDDVVKGEATHPKAPKWHAVNLERIAKQPNGINPRDVYHAVIIATYNETREILEPTVKAVLDSDFDHKKIILVIAYEGRDGAKAEKPALELVKEYGKDFAYAVAYKHPLTEGEVRGKGGNINFAGRQLAKLIKEKGIDPSNVLVTTLDADNRPHKKYLAGLTYVFSVAHDPKYLSFQPAPMFTNNIWDAPALMRVIATSNSFWMLVQGTRQHMLRNFSSHSQPLDALIDMDFWSARTIVEDGHHFWRSYFRFDGRHEVVPIFLPIYQDAVMADGYRRTLKAQFIQVRRWAWGASDVAYVAQKAFFIKNKVNKVDATFKFLRLLEGHVSWATSPLILLYGALIPSLLYHKNLLANQLPLIASNIERIALASILVSLYMSFKILPPKPARYKRTRTFWMVVQWVLLPISTLCYSAAAAIYSQTRLMFRRYIGSFDVTEKAVKKETGEVITSSKQES